MEILLFDSLTSVIYKGVEEPWSAPLSGKSMQHSQATVHDAYMIASHATAGRCACGLGGLEGTGQDMEIKDARGRYRGARQAPVDETTD